MSTRIFYNSQSEAIQLGRRVGIGGEGTVYEIQDKTDLVAKIYHEPPPPEKAEKLLALSRLGAVRLFNLSAWPVDVLHDQAVNANGNVIGFLMKKISEAEEVHALHSPKSRLQKFPDASWAFLIYVAANIARAVSVIHEHGYVVGDVNPKNILVTRKATVYLLDCDSFQISADGKTYRCEGGFPEYTPPELQGVTFKDVERNQTHDCFGLAVVIFQLLFLGRHPFSGRFSGVGEMPLERAIREHRFAFGNGAASRQMQPPPGTLSLEAIPASIIELFRSAFLSKHRPRARDWIEPLESLAKSLKKCNLHTGHHYFQELADCPWCGIEFRARIRLFNFGVTAPNLNRGNFRLDEIWKEIEVIAATHNSQAIAPLSQQMFSPLVIVSEQAKQFAEAKRKKLYNALWFSAPAGLLCGFQGGVCLGPFLLVGAIFIARKIAGAKPNPPDKIHSLMSVQMQKSEDPFVQQIETAKQKAEEHLKQLEERWQKEASGERFLMELSNLQSQKETHQNLARIRERRFMELESDFKAAQFEEYLSRFELSEANIAEVNLATFILLRSYGIETAADLTPPKLEQVRRTDEIGAKNLRAWREEIARQFSFDPPKGVPAQARLTVEREMDDLRFRLEHEMSSGAYYLRRIKQDIEDNQHKLEPLMAGAKKSLAQIEKDYEAVTKQVSTKLAIVVLIITFLLGLMSPPNSFGHQILTEYLRQPPPPVIYQGDTTSGQSDTISKNKALDLYAEGMSLARAEKYAEAARVFQECIKIKPDMTAAYEDLGRVLYRLKRYDESINASRAALARGSIFDAHYNLGLVYATQGNWEYAKNNLTAATASIRGRMVFEDRHIDAYYLLGKSLTKLSDVRSTIQDLERKIKLYPHVELERVELGNLYLWIDRNKAAEEMYGELVAINSRLAPVLNKLIYKHKSTDRRTGP